MSHPLMSIALLCTVLLGAGCASSPSTTTDTDLDLALAAYDRAAYDRALEHARSATGAEASYVAGLAASQLEQWAEAEQALESARRRSDDHRLTARATAALAVVHLATNRPESAARLLTAAQRDLTGRDLARARETERLARAQAGLSTTDTGDFTLQIGVFSSRNRAESARDAARSVASRAGLPAPVMTSDRDASGATIYRVQVGQFTSRDEAARVRNRFGLSDWYVRDAP